MKDRFPVERGLIDRDRKSLRKLCFPHLPQFTPSPVASVCVTCLHQQKLANVRPSEVWTCTLVLALSLAAFGAHLPSEVAQASLLEVCSPADSQDHVSEAISDHPVTEYCN